MPSAPLSEASVTLPGPDPYEIDEARKNAVGNGQVITLLCEGDMRRRRAIKGAGSGSAYRSEWLRVEVDGVKIFISDGNIVISKHELRP